MRGIGETGGIILAMMGFLYLTDYSTQRWSVILGDQPPAPGEEPVVPTEEHARALLGELVQGAGVFELHNEVYEAAGEDLWDSVIRDRLYHDITSMMIRDTGNPFPTEGQMRSWAQDNRERIQARFREYRDSLDD